MTLYEMVLMADKLYYEARSAYERGDFSPETTLKILVDALKLHGELLVKLYEAQA